MKKDITGERLARLETNVENIKDTQATNHSLILAKLSKIEVKMDTNMNHIDKTYVAKKDFQPIQDWVQNFKKNFTKVFVAVMIAIILAVMGFHFKGV